jgi:hypothetical protein
VICISSVPIPGIAAVKRASARQFILAYRELVRLACADNQVPAMAFAHLAFDGAVEEAVLQAIENDSFEEREGLGGPTSIRERSKTYPSFRLRVGLDGDEPLVLYWALRIVVPK